MKPELIYNQKLTLTILSFLFAIFPSSGSSFSDDINSVMDVWSMFYDPSYNVLS